MGKLTLFRDNLVNFVTGLGTWKDPSASLRYNLNLVQRDQLENAYRSDWISRRLVDAPADDAAREWRQWHASQDQIEVIEDVEREHNIQKKLRLALIRARLYGGAGMVLGVDDGKPAEEPLDIDAVGKDALKFVVVMNRYELAAGPRIYNVESPWYTYPEYFTVQSPLFGFYGEKGNSQPESWQGQAGDPARQETPQSGMVRIHPSRVVQFAGAELPDWRLVPLGGLWGDSILQAVEDILKKFGMTVGGLAAMVNDAKMDVVKIPEFSKKISTAEYANQLIGRFSAANQAKSVINTLVLDTNEEWERVQTNFGGVPQVLEKFMTLACASAGVPFSRVFGQQSRGLGGNEHSGASSDVKNYYDMIAADQKNVYTPALDTLDQVLLRSALGKFDPNVYYEWNPLSQPDPKEIAAISLQKAQATQVYMTGGLINEDALRAAVVNQLIEDGVYPGLEDAIDEFGEEPDEPDGSFDPQSGAPIPGSPVQAAMEQMKASGNGGDKQVGDAKEPTRRPSLMRKRTYRDFRKMRDSAEYFDRLSLLSVRDAIPRTLYVRRDVLNGDDIVKWAKAQGFSTTLPAAAMHVTIAFSKTLVDWMKMGNDYTGDDRGRFTVPPGGVRLLERLGDAVVLMFSSSQLAYRHEGMKKEGASWDHPEYQPHITVSWDVPEDFDLDAVEPYRGPIKLGPEIFEPVKEDWKSTIHEDAAE